MADSVEEQLKPSIARALQGLSGEYQDLVVQRYLRLRPVLLMLLRPRDILERNRTWPGAHPRGKAATTYLVPREANRARDVIDAFAASVNENPNELWVLFREWCRYGPIGLINAVSSDLTPVISDELQECVAFHRLAKHPRSDAGTYIRELLDVYADQLGQPRLPRFIARYAWAMDRKIDRWFASESEKTEHIPRTTRRLNLEKSYPHRRWIVRLIPLSIRCTLSRRHPIPTEPWLVSIDDECAGDQMGFRLCRAVPTAADLWLTLRWSIWHHDAPWWPVRGAADEVVVPDELNVAHSDQQALSYLRMRVSSVNAQHPLSAAGAGCHSNSLPHHVVSWLEYQTRKTLSDARHGMTLADLRLALLDLLREAPRENGIPRATPIALAESGCSLPWGHGIAAALLLPSGGIHRVHQGMVSLWGVPFDLTASGLPDGKEVDIRYDPDDARRTYAVYDNARVVPAPACAFEHRTTWLELVTDPAVLE
jgi:hypothetical protein